MNMNFSKLKDLVKLPSSSSSTQTEKELPSSSISNKPQGSELKSPLPKYPEGAILGASFNCYSEPFASEYRIRGHNYLVDKKKIASGPFLFPLRGVDLFLTKECPVNVGSNPYVMGGRVREMPTMIFNFRVPWGVLIFYSEIPERFLPFLRKGHESKGASQDPIPPLHQMPPSDRALCRWFLGDDAHRDATLKIIPVIVQGPTIVKSTVRGKPTIVGKQLPIQYIYQRPDSKLGLSEYFEIDLDIAGSSVAKRILSVVYSNTKHVTFDLGFVIQGNSNDELPEQMLLSGRIHGLDPQFCPVFPTKESESFSNNNKKDKEDYAIL